TANDGEAGLDALRSTRYDLCLLDVMMPVRSGFDVCRTARAEGVTTPIIMLTAKGQELDKVRGLEYGADDYVVKPFSLRELLARVKAVLRRGAPAEASDQATVGRLHVDFHTYEATLDDEPATLTHLEFEVLRYFHTRPSEPISRDQLLTDVWGYDGDDLPTTRTVDNFILKLRQKLEPDPARPRHLLTVHGVGYKYVP
ncbi:MAG: response regulator transcription factor, partial [Bacteroidota bacterium]